MAGLSGSILGLGVALSLAGAGSSSQHPIGSGIVSRTYGASARGPLGVYNFAGDLGKAALPGATSLLLITLSWHLALLVIAIVGLAVAMLIAIWLPDISRIPSRRVLRNQSSRRPHPAPASRPSQGKDLQRRTRLIDRRDSSYFDLEKF